MLATLLFLLPMTATGNPYITLLGGGALTASASTFIDVTGENRLYDNQFLQEYSIDAADLHFGLGAVGGLATGYDFGVVRTELEAVYSRQTIGFSEGFKNPQFGGSPTPAFSGNGTGGGDFALATGFLNIWLEHGYRNFEIYAGGGGGLVYGRISGFTAFIVPEFPGENGHSTRPVDGGNATWGAQGGAGLRYRITPHWDVSLNYRAVYIGDLEIEVGDEIGKFTIPRIWSHRIMAGLGYSF